jgi:hypothetical protein
MAVENRPSLNGLEPFTVGEKEILAMCNDSELDHGLSLAKNQRPNLKVELEVEGLVFLSFKDRASGKKVTVSIEPTQTARLAGMLCMAADGNDSKGNLDGGLEVS